MLELGRPMTNGRAERRDFRGVAPMLADRNIFRARTDSALTANWRLSISAYLS
jgi:hypothetical protein